EIEDEAESKLRELVKNYGMGLTIEQVQLKNVNPPQLVQASFNSVNQAKQEKEQAINVANGDYNKEVPRAKGEAEKRVTEAEGYAKKRVNEAEGDVAAFEALLAEYAKAPAVTKRRIYLETMGEILPSVGKKIILDDAGTGVLPLLNLDGAK
ncbi:MAG: protease modulator HflK, partial [Verrucomicrobiales bacterium]|nr:protease modulator HflK [Verrucomicrobiales bacterium]